MRLQSYHATDLVDKCKNASLGYKIYVYTRNFNNYQLYFCTTATKIVDNKTS